MYDDGILSKDDKAARMRDLLHFDPLAQAEVLTGESYKENEGVAMLGMGIQMVHSETKRTILKGRKDSYMSIPLHEYEEIIKDMGFVLIFEEAFNTSNSWGTDYLKIWFHPDGMLLVYDTYGPDNLNGGHVYYNCQVGKRKKMTNFYKFISSGKWTRVRTHGITRWIWIGSHDCREAIRFNLDQLREHSKFINPWRERQFLWFLHYMDTKPEGYDHRAITNRRWEQFPDYVKKCVPLPFPE